ncbi:ubiquitin-protein ligase E3 [Schizosaccharomyces japonicus yFS275]|uniref:Ubiquitin-protein ligase E3 n=1 Tax=Schizosaccharomyces japonicus (strain yFS275 / FY16936) TaxID=402676 RepID=B6K2E7_SCHJY|nr:ubiquitin-protein ligase E3 [Schizosaccharomyces japonicus yFS275]EEB07328.2 ubiquitin-protein ligase E3 [Schizosaccharomyces japonicus yFS275]
MSSQKTSSASKLNAHSASFVPSVSSAPLNTASSRAQTPNKTGTLANAPSNQPKRGRGRSAKGKAAAPRKNQGLAGSNQSQRNRRRANKRIESVADSVAMTLDEGVGDEYDDLIDMLVAKGGGRVNKRGQMNLNHLLNFKLPPRTTSSTAAAPRRPKGYASYGYGSGHHPMDKARFVNANYRFVVSPLGDYTMQVNNPEMPVPWEDVWQVLSSADSQTASCPFCLEEAKEATNSKIRPKCGARTCPICWDVLRMRDMKPVRWVHTSNYQRLEEKQKLQLVLYIRVPGSVLALPRTLGLHQDMQDPTIRDNLPRVTSEKAKFARILLGSHEYLVEQFLEEIQELTRVQDEDRQLYGESDVSYEKAINTISENISLYSQEASDSIEQLEVSLKRLNVSQFANNTKLDALPQSSSKRDGGASSSSMAVASGNVSNDPFLFYQPFPHSHIYLAPLDVRILRSVFGSYQAFPDEIQPLVEHVSSGHSVDRELKQRCKYLSHLPDGCEVSFIECDWSQVVPADALAPFKDAIHRRRRAHKEQDKWEERQRKRAMEATENQIYSELNLQRPLNEPRPPRDELFGVDAFPTLGSEKSQASTPKNESASASTASLPVKTTVWGTRVVDTSTGNSDSDEPDGWGVDWKQLNASLQKDSSTVDNGNKKKKKKKKKLVLLSSGGPHR